MAADKNPLDCYDLCVDNVPGGGRHFLGDADSGEVEEGDREDGGAEGAEQHRVVAQLVLYKNKTAFNR